MDRIGEHRLKGLRRREIVAEATDGVRTLRSVVGPHAQQVDEEVAGELRREHLRDDVQVGNQGRLQNDRNVRRVEQFDRVRRGLTTVTSGFDWKVNTETLDETNLRFPAETSRVDSLGSR